MCVFQYRKQFSNTKKISNKRFNSGEDRNVQKLHVAEEKLCKMETSEKNEWCDLQRKRLYLHLQHQLQQMCRVYIQARPRDARTI